MGGRWRGAGVVAIGALALAGCWPAPGQGPGRQSHNPFETAITVESVASLDEVWVADTGDDALGPPITSPGRVHVQGGAVLHTLDRSDGGELWRYQGPTQAPGATMSDPIWQDGEIFMGYGFGNLGGNWTALRLDAATGEVAGSLPGGLVEGVRGPAAALSSFAFGSGTPVASYLTVVADVGDPATGWSGLLSIRDWSTPAGPRLPATVGTEGVYHAGRGPLSTTPSSSAPSGTGVRLFDVERPPSCRGGPSASPYVPCPTWVTTLDGTPTTSPVIGPAEETVYVGSGAGTVYALDAATGAVRWSAAVGSAVAASPALADGTLFVPTEGGDLVVLDAEGCGAETCAPLWSAPGASELTVQPAVAGGVVFTGSADGSVRAFPAAGCGSATCGPLWEADTGSRITGAPAVSGGRLYLGTQDGRLIVYEPTGTGS